MYDYTVNGNIYLKGDGNGKNLKLTVAADSKLILDGVLLEPQEIGNALTCQGNATIILIGNNRIDGKCTKMTQEANAIRINAGTLTIDGEGSLVATGYGYYGAGILAANGASIIINGGTITAQGGTGDSSWGYSGIGSTNSGGNITINGGTISASAGPASSGIGSCIMTSCGDILITGENTIVTATAGKKRGDCTPADIGAGCSGNCGTVTFTGGATVNGTKYN